MVTAIGLPFSRLYSAGEFSLLIYALVLYRLDCNTTSAPDTPG
jgi:hypothetical protein